MKFNHLFLIAFFLFFSYSYHLFSQEVKPTSDMIESTPHNDDKRGSVRTIQYMPDGEDFLSINGKNRYTRALYGSHTAWRIETSDRPIFATYVKGDCRNIRFLLCLRDSTKTPLEMTSWCEARYTPGRRSYLLRDDAWGNGILKISVLSSPTEEKAIWKISHEGLPTGSYIEALNSNIKNPKLSRSGDLGVDPPDSFDPDDGGLRQTLKCSLEDNSDLYIEIFNNELCQIEGKEDFSFYEEARENLASRIKISTPDPFFNTLGGALCVAADGIWGTEGVWLHGAVGWRMPLSGWRAAYVGDVLGWHDRAREHFDNYAESQVVDVPCIYPHPQQDSLLSLARSEKKWGTPQYSNGYICRNPQRRDQMHHYDMNLCYIDELLWHFNWTGDLDYAKKMWNVITSHLAWEKLNYDPDDDGLYDAYACIWASDALYYNSGAVTHSSAYNYRANKLAAMIAEKIGENPEPYKKEADKILKALNNRLWIKDKGYWAEFQDFMGHKKLHESSALWTIYHAIDSDVTDPFQAYLSTHYVDSVIPHIPVKVIDSIGDDNIQKASREINQENYSTISTTNWMPYSWSINNVAFAEVMHTALSYFEAGRSEEGYRLLKASFLDGMYLGESPGNFGQVSFYDAARGECYRDFGDPIGVASRVIVEGLFGILPDAMNSRLVLRPGFPSKWDHASISTPDVFFSYKGDENKKIESYRVVHHLEKVDTLEVLFPARSSMIESIKVNGENLHWELSNLSVGRPILKVKCQAQINDSIDIEILWKGDELLEAKSLTDYPEEDVKKVGPITFVKISQDDMTWWAIAEIEKYEEPLDVSLAKASIPLGEVNPKKCVPINIDNLFNASVTDIFENKYLSPRSPYTTLQIPVQGIGDWCHPLYTVEINDSGLREKIKDDKLLTPQGIPFLSHKNGYNIVFTSLFDNYPDSISFPLTGKASSAYLLLGGSTNHMQCDFLNAKISVYYEDGTKDYLPLISPINWTPIEHIFFEDGLAFNRKAPKLTRLELKTGEVSDSFEEELGSTGATCIIDGGAALLLKMPLNKKKKLSKLVLESVANEVVIGIMGITLQR